MLIVYSAIWCPHCVRTEAFLKKRGISFESVNIDTAAPEVVEKVSEVNGGEWVIPTLEFNGRWRKGKVFREEELEADLKAMGVPV